MECAAGSDRITTMTLRHLVWRLREEFYPEKHPYDEETGCDTSGMIHRRRLGPHAEDYQPVDPEVFRTSLEHIPEDLAAFSFVDIGCGKGRALLLAEEYAFRKIIGVESSRKLAKIASANAAKIGSTRISVLHSDARRFEFPPEPLVIFLYNPFSGEILRSVMKQLGQHPSALYIIYVNPVYNDVISSQPHMKLVANDEWCAVWKLFHG
jgi:SAM-dependent methyltransferase